MDRRQFFYVSMAMTYAKATYAADSTFSDQEIEEFIEEHFRLYNAGKFDELIELYDNDEGMYVMHGSSIGRLDRRRRPIKDRLQGIYEHQYSKGILPLTVGNIVSDSVGDVAWASFSIAKSVSGRSRHGLMTMVLQRGMLGIKIVCSHFTKL